MEIMGFDAWVEDCGSKVGVVDGIIGLGVNGFDVGVRVSGGMVRNVGRCVGEWVGNKVGRIDGNEVVNLIDGIHDDGKLEGIDSVVVVVVGTCEVGSIDDGSCGGGVIARAATVGCDDSDGVFVVVLSTITTTMGVGTIEVVMMRFGCGMGRFVDDALLLMGLKVDSCKLMVVVLSPDDADGLFDAAAGLLFTTISMMVTKITIMNNKIPEKIKTIFFVL